MSEKINLNNYRLNSIFNIGEYLNYRTYFKIDIEGNIERRPYNPCIIYITFVNDIEKINSCIENSLHIKERQKFYYIKRHSNLSIEELKIKLMKALYKENLNFVLEFSKELLLRDKKEFFTLLYNFCFLDNIKNLKFLYAYTLEFLLNIYDYDDRFLFIILNYITKSKNNYLHKELKKEYQINEKNLKLYNLAKNIIINNNLSQKDFFIKKITYELKDKIILNKYIEEILEQI